MVNRLSVERAFDGLYSSGEEWPMKSPYVSQEFYLEIFQVLDLEPFSKDCRILMGVNL